MIAERLDAARPKLLALAELPYARAALLRSRRIRTHVTSFEQLMLHRMARTAPTGAVVEIGAYLGATSLLLAHAASQRSSDRTLHCVDTWQNEGMADGLRDTFAQF
jgi:predicted O-methyltransferase YrrM